MYKCKECGNIFSEEELKKVSYESYYGVSDEFNYSCKTVDVCPNCGEHNYEEYIEEDLWERKIR